MSDQDKLAAVRAAMPSPGGRIQMNTGSAGRSRPRWRPRWPLEAYERDFGRAPSTYYLDSVPRMEEARAAVAAGSARAPTIAIKHATRTG